MVRFDENLGKFLGNFCWNDPKVEVVEKWCSMARLRAESLYFKNLLAILGSKYILGVKIPDLGRKKSKNVIFLSVFSRSDYGVLVRNGRDSSPASICVKICLFWNGVRTQLKRETQKPKYLERETQTHANAAYIHSVRFFAFTALSKLGASIWEKIGS